MGGIQQLSTREGLRESSGLSGGGSISNSVFSTPNSEDASMNDRNEEHKDSTQHGAEVENRVETSVADSGDTENKAPVEAEAQEDAEAEAMEEERRRNNASAAALTLEIVGDLPHADVKPPENILFVCKLNPVTKSEDLELIFSRFGEICSCEVIRDKKAYSKMQNVLIDDRRIWVDFSQSVSRLHNVWVKQRTGRPPNERNTQSSSTRSRHVSASNTTLMRPEYNTQGVLVDLDAALETQYNAGANGNRRELSSSAHNNHRRSYHANSSRSRGHREEYRSSSRYSHRDDTHNKRHGDRRSSLGYSDDASERTHPRPERNRDDYMSRNRPHYERYNAGNDREHNSYRTSDARRHDYDRRHRQTRDHDDLYHKSTTSRGARADHDSAYRPRSQSPR